MIESYSRFQNRVGQCHPTNIYVSVIRFLETDPVNTTSPYMESLSTALHPCHWRCSFSSLFLHPPNIGCGERLDSMCRPLRRMFSAPRTSRLQKHPRF